jgi:LuxR family maltose regulon positive regulatory protein
MLLLHREMLLALGQHELSRAQDYGDRLLQDMQNVPPMQRVMILNSLTYAQQELYIFRGAERYYAQAKTLIPELDSWVSSIPLETFYARHLFQTGRTAAAVELLEATLARLVEETGPRPVLGSIAAIVLAEIKFETGAFGEAAQLLLDYGGNVEQFGFLPMTLAARIVQARLHMARGEHDHGFAVLERPLVGAGELFDKMSRALAVERIYWLFRLGRVEAAKQACGAIGLSLVRAPEPHSSAAAAEEGYAMAWIQLARAQKRIDDALHVAQKWQRYTEGVGAVHSNVRWNVILASLQVLAEEPGQAMRHLRRAVPQGAGGSYRGAFLAEVDVLGEQLALLVRSDLSEAERAFLAGLLDVPSGDEGAAGAPGIAVPLGAFSSREAAILRLVAKGMLNREIGGALGMTEGTVKWYLQRIYDKLGVRRRSQVALMVSQWHARPVRDAEALH